LLDRATRRSDLGDRRHGWGAAIAELLADDHAAAVAQATRVLAEQYDIPGIPLLSREAPF
jgi:hypothetical protein